MMTALTELLNNYRLSSVSEREKGTCFEQLIQKFLQFDPVFAGQFSEVMTFANWARGLGKYQNDKGIDLVARNIDGDGYCAIQCKFYAADHQLRMDDFGTFFIEAGKKEFTRLLIVDSTATQWSVNAEQALEGQSKPVTRIGLKELEDSAIDWSIFQSSRTIQLRPKKSLRPHQQKAVTAVINGLANSDRGKLIMACGTGKTFTSLKLAEEMAGRGKNVLFVVPSLALMSQSIAEWTQESELPLRSFAVCSDVQVGIRKQSDDTSDISIHDLAFPATTNAADLVRKFALHPELAQDKMNVVFSTYHSIDVIAEAQKQGLPEFDLIICDEAHRTTGATFDGDESNFVKIHNQDLIKGRKRLYMTATPRIFGDLVKSKAKEASVELASMDDQTKYGETLHALTFAEAVQADLLCRYKVIVLAVNELDVTATLQARNTEHMEEGGKAPLALDDVTRMIGCFRGLSLIDAPDKPGPMRRAVAFCNSIKASKLLKQEFVKVVEEYRKHPEVTRIFPDFTCEVSHVDGTFNATARNSELAWLKADHEDQKCRILSNARCLTEGVDVPALDAIMFLHPRKSQIDVIQAVGRVMRRSEGKELGYVILPIGVPAGQKAELVLADNERYRVVIQVLSALRAHDDEFESVLNKIDLGVDVSDMIQVIDATSVLPQRKEKKKEELRVGEDGPTWEGQPTTTKPVQIQDEFVFDEYQKGIYALLVKKLVKKDSWAYWAADIADVARKHITRITGILQNPDNTAEQDKFDLFLKGLKEDLNDSITKDDAIEMLAQHIITRPVFDVLFEDYSFAASNPVSRVMQSMLDLLDRHQLETEAESLKKFYASVRMRVSGITDIKAKQRIIVELYDEFFRNAFPGMASRLGIVYTPVEVVDFIIHSVNDILKSEFGQNLGSDGVHIIDPFTGTGTFITRLMQSGLITPDQLRKKYQSEIHANEIVLLAYYIAAINIEMVYYGITGDAYTPFEGICLTDTFQLYEKEDLGSHEFRDNSGRRKRQKELDIRVIIGNPPYSAGQGSANDNNQNIAYPHLDGLIRDSYAAHSRATNMNALYDSYIRAIRWASDRIGQSGVIGFVSGNGFIEKPAMDGLRKCLWEEFSAIHVLNLRGDIRKNMLSKGLAKEGQNIFGSGSMTGIAVTVFVKNPTASEYGRIFYHNIGDDLTKEEKLARLVSLQGIAGITRSDAWHLITPDQHHDWIGQRDNSFAAFISLGDKKNKNETTLFENYSSGLKTQRDAWCYNASQTALVANMTRMIDFYNGEVKRLGDAKLAPNMADDFINTDPTKISWTRALKQDLAKKRQYEFGTTSLTPSLYRPFTRQWLYFDRRFNEMVYQMPRIFPDSTVENRVICVSGIGARSGFSALMVNHLPNLHTLDTGQCFPLKLYETTNTASRDDDLLGPVTANDGYKIKDAITDAGMSHFSNSYPGRSISKEDLFYYIYGILHSPDYRERYADNLSKELPRIPAVRRFDDFMTFSDAGRKLAELHVGYERVEPYPATITGDDSKDFRVIKMKFADKADKSRVIYNHKITISNIPLEAWEYVVNGKAALDWVMERQSVRTDRDSGIVNDANDWAIETVGDPAYPLKLFLRVITVSLETMKIVNGLPVLDI